MAGPETPLTGFLGPGAAWRGDLTFEGRLRIDGQYEGRIYSEGTLELGASGLIRGEVDVAFARVAGTVEGHLRVRESLVVEDGGVLRGEVHAAHVRLARGARVECKVHRIVAR